MTTHGTITRRAFMALTGVAAASLLVDTDSAIAATSASSARQHARVTGEGAVATCFSEDWRERVEVSFPQAVAVHGVHGLRYLDFSWDGRLFAVDDIYLVHASGVLTQAAERPGERRARVAVPTDAVQVIPVVRALAIYPHDALGNILPSVVAVAATTNQKMTSPLRRSRVKPWGIELEATWTEASSGVSGDGTYRGGRRAPPGAGPHRAQPARGNEVPVAEGRQP